MLFRVIAGLIKVNSGEVLYNGEDLFQKTKKIVVIVSSKSIKIRVDQKFKVSLKNIRDNVSCRKTKKQTKRNQFGHIANDICSS